VNYQTIYINQIPEEGLTLNVRFDPEVFSGDDTGIVPVTPVTFKGMIRPVAGRYLLSGRLSTVIRLTCDRCLAHYTSDITQDVLVHFVVRKTHEQLLEVIESKDADDLDDIIDDRIDLVGVLREQIVLQIPMKALCSESCRGLCSRCGANLNEAECGCNRTSIDPRLIKLKDLLEK